MENKLRWRTNCGHCICLFIYREPTSCLLPSVAHSREHLEKLIYRLLVCLTHAEGLGHGACCACSGLCADTSNRQPWALSSRLFSGASHTCASGREINIYENHMTDGGSELWWTPRGSERQMGVSDNCELSSMKSNSRCRIQLKFFSRAAPTSAGRLLLFVWFLLQQKKWKPRKIENPQTQKMFLMRVKIVFTKRWCFSRFDDRLIGDNLRALRAQAKCKFAKIPFEHYGSWVFLNSLA